MSSPLQRARQALAAEDKSGALNALLQGMQAAPEDGPLWLEAGRLLARLGEHKTASQVLRRAAALLPRSTEAHLELGMALTREGVRREPEACYRQAVQLEPGDPMARVKLGHALLREARLEEAEAQFRAAMDLAPQQRDGAVGLALVMESRRETEQAHALLAPRLDQPNTAAATAWARVCRRRGASADALPVLRQALARVGGDHERAILLHALGDALDDLGRVDEAFQAFARANALRGLSFDGPAHRRQLRALAAQFSAQRMAGFQRGSSDSQLPVLIVGMPRSGTSLLEQILAAHPAVAGGGELEALRDLAAEAYTGPITGQRLDALAQRYLGTLRSIGPQAQRVTDKMPHNFLHLGLTALMLPRARVICCLRDPADCCWSCFRQAFGAGLPYTASLQGLGLFYRAFAELTDHWRQVLPLRWLDLRYEELVAEPETQIRRLLDFLDLPWEQECLRFHQSGRVVATASRAEVQEPLHGRSVGRAAPYRPHLGPLLALLED